MKSADDIGFKLDGKQVILKGMTNNNSDEVEDKTFDNIFEKTIETPDIVLKNIKN